MASEPIGGEGDVVKEKQRFTEYKVYTRKVFKGSRKNAATGHPAAPASKESAAASKESAAPAPVEPAALAPDEPACPAEPASKEPAEPAPEEPAAPAPEEPAVPAPEEPAAPTPEEPACPAALASKEPAVPAPVEPAAPTPEEPACPAAPAPDEPVAPTPEEPACPAVPAPNEHVVPSPDHSACPTPSNPPDTTPGPNPNGPPAPPPNVLAIPSPEDPAATTNFADPSNTVVTGTDDRKNVEGNCAGNNNITPGSINNNANDDHNSNKALEPVTEDVNLTTLQAVTSSGTVCDDSSRLNRQRDEVEVAGPRPQDLPLGNIPINMVVENQTKVNSASRSKQDTRELRQKLETELGIVRSWVKRIEEKQGQLSGYGPSHASKERVDDNAGSAKIARSEVASVGIPREVSRPFHQLRLSVLDHSLGLGDSIEKEKRTPKANQFYRNSEFLLAKDKFPPAESNKKSKSNGKKLSGELGLGFLMGSKFFKSCSSLLEKLMKHKHGWVFNTPVDVEGLGLLDYFVIIKHPMDLGTVKMRLTKNWYKSPKEFAEDVRLTFRNAMTYNPKGQDVHIMAEQLSKIFEERWVIIESDFNREMRLGLDYGVALSTPTSRKAHPRPTPLDMRRILDRSESMSHLVDSMPKAITLTPSSRTPAPKKPKAKDPDKRDMTYEEKQKLSTKLQSLPLERLDAVVQIIKKRNSALFQNDEEIEVDIDSVDAETLWELDRFVTNYKKSLSKKKRKAELAIQASQARANSEHEVPGKTLAPAMSDATRENKADQNAVSSVSAFQGEKQGDNRGRSSSSSSSSSDSETSSSDSDSESSSASGSDTGSPRT